MVGTGRIGEAGGPDEDFLEISIRDSGPGISEEDELRIFEPFYSTKDGGTGLGLYVSKGIVERHGGEITVHSGAEGCAFAIRLPLKTSSEEDSHR
jgi:signal transduction histidine kinase